MKKLLILAIVMLAGIVALHASSFDRIVGVGKDREKLTPQLLEARMRLLQDAQEFWLLRHPKAEGAPARCMKYWPLFESGSTSVTPRIDPFLLASVAFVESYCEADAQSPTGPRGLGQFSRASAKEEGLVIKTERRQIGTRVTRKARWVGTGKNRRLIPAVTKPVYGDVVVYDERLMPEKIIPAMARRFSRTIRLFGNRGDFAVQEYHDGMGRVLRVLSAAAGGSVNSSTAAAAIKRPGLSYASVYFGNTPYYRTGVYSALQRLPDFGKTYYPRVIKAWELLANFRKDPSSYAKRFALHRNRFDDRVAPSRMWTFFTPEQVEQLKFEDLAAIQEATRQATGSVTAERRLVPLPVPYAQYGLSPRLAGKSPIAERDPKNRQAYVASEPATVGLLIYIANEARLLAGRNFQAIEVNSLVRSEEYQGRLQGSNPNARTALPTHTIGKAFDLPLKGKSSAYRRDLLFILSDLESVGMLAFIPEGSQDTIHVVVHPEWEQFFTVVYQKATASR